MSDVVNRALGWARGLTVVQQAMAAGGVLVGVIALVVLVVALSGGSAAADDDVVVVATPPPAATPTPTVAPTSTPRPTSTPTPTETATAEVTEEPEPGLPVVTSVSQMVSEYGYPSNATFARLRIPSIGVDARVGSYYVGTGQSMPNPAGPVDVAWYDLSAWNNMGGAPGQGGNAIFSGHVDYNATVSYANVHYRGQAVFSRLSQLNVGDIIEVDYNGETFRYAVTWMEFVPAVGGNWARIWDNRVVVDSVTLYTCGGDFNPATKSYADRKVVRAERI